MTEGPLKGGACGICSRPVYIKEETIFCEGCNEEMIDCTCPESRVLTPE